MQKLILEVEKLAKKYHDGNKKIARIKAYSEACRYSVSLVEAKAWVEENYTNDGWGEPKPSLDTGTSVKALAILVAELAEQVWRMQAEIDSLKKDGE